MDEESNFENPMEVDCKPSKDILAVQTHNGKESSHGIEINESEQLTVSKIELNDSDLTNNLDPAVSDKVSSCGISTVEVLEDVSMEVDRQETTEREADVENDKEQEETSRSYEIKQISPVTCECVQCEKVTDCSYIYVDRDDKNRYLCTDMCITAYRLEHPGCTVTNKKYVIKEITSTKMTCSECNKEKICYFYCQYDGEHTYYCSETCLESMMADKKDKFTYERKKITVIEMEPKAYTCFNCNATKPCTFSFARCRKRFTVCSMNCVKDIIKKEDRKYVVIPCKKTRKAAAISTQNPSRIAREERECTFTRSCMQCFSVLTSADVLTWQTVDFCNEVCLELYLNKISGKCKKCKNTIQHTCLGKYCARFGCDIFHFCSTDCLEEYKKGVRMCCYCQRDISASLLGFFGFFGADEQFKDFCSQNCLDKLMRMRNNPVPQPVWSKCVVCLLKKPTTIEVKVKNANGCLRLCSDTCFAAFKFANNILPDQCTWCKKYFERKQSKCFTIYENTKPSCFCSKSCMNVFISNSRLIVPCNWCKVKKYNFDMIKRTQPSGQVVMMCSLNCLNLYQVSVNAVSSRSAGKATRRGRGMRRALRARGGARAAAALSRGGDRQPSIDAESPGVETIDSEKAASPQLTAAPSEPPPPPAKRRRRLALSPPPSPVPMTLHEPQLNMVDCSSSISYAWPADDSKDPLSFGLDQSSPSPVEDQSWDEPVPSPVELCDKSGQSTPRKVRKPSPPKETVPEVEFEFIDMLGGEDDSGAEGSDAELSLPMLVPRAQRVYFCADEEPPLLVPPARGAASPPPPGSLGPTDMFAFDWGPSPQPPPPPPPPPTDRREAFAETECGPTATFLTPYDAFVAIWDWQFMERVAAETNRHAQELGERGLRDGSLKPSSRLQHWKDTSADELYVYFALLVATGLCVKADLKEYWLQGDVLSTPNIARHMSIPRFYLLTKCLRFGPASPRAASLPREEAKLHDIDPVVKHLNSKFRSLYRLGRDVAVDESLTQWRGSLDNKKCSKNKAASVGIKSVELCESPTGYIWRFKVYAERKEGAESEATPGCGAAAGRVLELLQGLQYRGHTVWVDQHYSSPALARLLKSLGFDCVGPVRTSRPAVPRQLATLTEAAMAAGQLECLTSGDVDILVWRNHQARVAALSTYHGAAVRTAYGKTTPVAVHDYNSCMAGLDRKDRILNAYPIERKRTLWYKKLFNRLLNVSILNAHILHKHSSVPEKLGYSNNHRNFRRKLLAQLIERHGTLPIVYSNGAAQNLLKKPAPVLPSEVLDHFPAVYTFAPGKEKKERIRRYCVLCRKRISTYCPTCDVPLCAYDCIKKYHQATK